MSNEEIIIDYVMKNLDRPFGSLLSELRLLKKVLEVTPSYDWVNIIRAALQDSQEKEMQQGQ